MSKMMKMRSYQTVVLLLAKYTKRYWISSTAIEKVAEKYKYADEYKLRLMYEDLDLLDCEDNINYDRLSELMEMIEESE